MRPRRPTNPHLGVLGVAYVLMCMALLFAPLLSLVVFSFNTRDALGLPFEGFTLRWFAEFFADRQATEALNTTVLIASIVTVACTLLGLVSAYSIARGPKRLGAVALAAHGIPLVVPWLVIGVAGLLFFQWLGLSGSVLTIVLMQVVVTFPLSTMVLYAGLTGLEPSTEEAGRDLGSTQVGVLIRIVLPQLLIPMVTSAVFAFLSSVGNFVVTFFVSGYSSTLPIWSYSALRHSQDLPVVNAGSTVMLGINVVLFIVVIIVSRRDREAVPTWI